MQLLDELIYKWLEQAGFERYNLQLPQANLHCLSYPGDKDKPTVLVVHGIGANAAHFLACLYQLLRLGFPVVALDLPSHGLSSDFQGKLSSPRLYDYLVKFVKFYAPRQFIIIANSLGGALSLNIGLEYPERILGMVISSPAGGFPDEESWEGFKENFKTQNPEQARMLLERAFHRYPWYGPIVEPELIKRLNRPGVMDIVQCTHLNDFCLDPSFSNFNFPTQVIWGRSDELFPRSNLEWFKANMPTHVSFSEPSDIGHCPHIEDITWFNHNLVKFIDGVTGNTDCEHLKSLEASLIADCEKALGISDITATGHISKE